MDTCSQHSGFDERIKALEKVQDRVKDRLSKVELALAGLQGKWAIIAVVGMAAVTALFKYVLP